MARIHGRNGRLYASLTSGGTAEPITFLRDWSINFAVDNIEVTAFGDSNKTYVAGLPDASGSYSGFYDDGTVQFAIAAQNVPPNEGREVYAVWLTREGGKPRRLGFAQTPVDESGILTTGGPQQGDEDEARRAVRGHGREVSAARRRASSETATRRSTGRGTPCRASSGAAARCGRRRADPTPRGGPRWAGRASPR